MHENKDVSIDQGYWKSQLKDIVAIVAFPRWRYKNPRRRIAAHISVQADQSQAGHKHFNLCFLLSRHLLGHPGLDRKPSSALSLPGQFSVIR